MTFITLISVLLLALVVSSLPILPDSKQTLSAQMQDSAQAVFFLRSSHPDGFQRDARMDIGPTSAAGDNDYLSFDAVPYSRVSEVANVAGLGPFDQQTTTVVSSGDGVPITQDPPDHVTKDVKAGTFLTSVSTLLLIFSCAVVLLALACVGLGLFAIKYLRTQILCSHKAWQILPRVEKHALLSSYKGNSGSGTATAVTQVMLHEKCEESPYSSARAPTPLSCVSITSPDDLEEDSGDEKFHDALDTPLSFNVHDHPSHDPSLRDLPFLPITPALSPTPDDRSTPPQAFVPLAINTEVREPHARPSWSLRVATLIPAPPSSPLIYPRSRAYRAVPEFDIALAMQLRPGRGVGADPAWMVRFLMAIFGWFAVALTGTR
ncbi:uncharacterized protein EDB91DRAFT_1166291 [Suillus paluster]|uniref:uncharacterized protein n=1 Tax=Suillus paluster TaxID=48578 RepID=UPI001B85D5A1|nr:uncharacterized protein EDB91DRAFT_1166291 [Suillus paluster]KAG1726434.1 hypothetical protein EDB91DRAFT_1166291 [Suillus paluster]